MHIQYSTVFCGTSSPRGETTTQPLACCSIARSISLENRGGGREGPFSKIFASGLHTGISLKKICTAGNTSRPAPAAGSSLLLHYIPGGPRAERRAREEIDRSFFRIRSPGALFFSSTESARKVWAIFFRRGGGGKSEEIERAEIAMAQYKSSSAEEVSKPNFGEGSIEIFPHFLPSFLELFDVQNCFFVLNGSPPFSCSEEKKCISN